MTEQAQHMEVKTAKKYYQKAIFVIILMIAAFWFGFERGKQTSAPGAAVPIQGAVVVNRTSDQQVDFSLFWDTWDMLKRKYVDAQKLDAQKLVYGAIKGMLQATGDPYTTFLDPKENREFAQDISGTFEGIGAELGIKGGVLTVVAPIEDSPAARAGLRAGDKIMKIDGKITADMSIEEAVDKIRGPKGTAVTLTIFHEGDQDTREVQVQRDTINVKSVDYEVKEGSIAYIKITQFGDDTTKEFSAAIQKAATANPKGIIIDLRNNPGGYLESAIDVASKLLPNGKVVVIEEDSNKSQKKMYTRGGDVASKIPTVVLINEGSASASEILAGALKDNRENITLVGKKSYGKGSVQEFIDLPKQTAVKITVARWLTPTGKQINEEGIHPDIEINLSAEDFQNGRDPQLDAALEQIKKTTN